MCADSQTNQNIWRNWSIKLQSVFLKKVNSVTINFKSLLKDLNQQYNSIKIKSNLKKYFFPGESVRLYYYLSPLDLIQHHQVSNKNNEGFDITYKIISSLTTEELIKNDLGTYLSISLLSALESPNKNKPLDTYKLPDCSLLTLNQNDDERNWSEAFSPYFNNNFSFEK